MTKKLDIFEILGAIDLGGKTIWTELSDNEKKQVTFVVLNRWCSSINGTREQQELAVLKTNEYFNKNLFNISTSKSNDHRQLLWYLLCMSGDTKKIERHNWIKLEKVLSKDKKTKIIHQLKPELGTQEVQTLAAITTDDELKKLVEEHGLEP